jgi:hypothetical protein
VPLVRASHTVAGWRNGDDEKLMGAILGQFRQERIQKKMFFFYLSPSVLNPEWIILDPAMT